MKFSCNKELLQKNLHIAQRATDPKSNISVLRNVLLELGDNKLDVVSFDHRMGIKTTMECVSDQVGRTTIQCNLLLDCLNSITEENVYFTLDGNTMKLESGSFNYTINCISADDFPPFPEAAEEKSFELNKEMLEKGVKQTILATNQDDPRAFMGGVFIKTEGTNVIFVGTDGHRLSFRKFESGEKSLPAFEIIAPARTLSELLRIVSEIDSDKIKVGVAEKSVTFTMGGVFLVSRLVDAKYPKYERVIPENQDGSCRVARQKMISAVRGAAIMARSKENKDMVEMSITDETITFASKTQDEGSASVEINVAKKGRDVRFAFNSKYILDFLNAVDDDEIIIDFTEELSPSMFHTDSPDYKYVLMPIKV